MKRLLMTTALMTVLAAPLAAQQDRLQAPEGYAEFGDITRLTLDDLQGATILDVNGETLGDITDLVFAAGGEGEMTTEGQQDDEMSDDALTEQQEDSATQDEEQPDADTANEAIENIGEQAEQAVDDIGDSDAADNGDEPEGERISVGVGQVSHVVIDIGGFLGIGGHTIAVPIQALRIFADEDENLRIFLPWTEEQLRDLPAYEEGNPDTLGRMTD
jgi:hypothetical protein